MVALLVPSYLLAQWPQEEKLLAEDGESFDHFGWSVSLSGNTVLIGANRDDDNGERSGSAYIYENDGIGNCIQVAKLLPNDGAAADRFGYAVSVSGDYALIGAFEDDESGSAYIFESNEMGVWNQVAKLLPDGDGVGDFFGFSVSISGDIAVVGARLDDDNGDDSGSAYVFEKDQTGYWQETAKLLANDGSASDVFGYSVSVSGNRILIGASGDDDNGGGSGSAYVFEKDVSGNWLQNAKIIANDGAASDFFGWSVSLSSNTALVGAFGDDDNGNNSGSAYIFENDSDGNWLQTAKILPDDGADSDQFGQSVSISGKTAFIGSRYDDDNGSSSGSAYVFEKNGSENWVQTAKLLADDGQQGDQFGRSVAISGNAALTGAYRDNDNGDNAGSAYLFSEVQCSETDIQAELLSLESSMEEEFLPNGDVRFSWSAPAAALGCKIQGKKAGSGTIVEETLVGGDFSEWIQPSSSFAPDAEYLWRAGCGCAFNPTIWTGYTSFKSFIYTGLEITIFPNPSISPTTVSFKTFENERSTLEIIDPNGRTLDVLYSGTSSSNREIRVEYDTAHLPVGVYLYRLSTENKVIQEKFVKTN